MKVNQHIELLNKFLDGKCDIKEVKELYSICEHSDQIDEWTLQQWEKADSEIPAQIEEKMFFRVNNKCSRDKKNILIYFWEIAAIFLLCLTTAVGINLLNQDYIGDNIDNKYLINVEKGQRANIILPDMTKVWINSGSSISYSANYGNKSRVIDLEGEAYFEVAKNEDKPFIVNTKHFSVKALGTAFNVKAYKEDNTSSTSLMSGMIEVKTTNTTELLSPNQRLVYDKTSEMTSIYMEEDIANYITWKDHLLFLNNESFETIAKELNRRYNVDIVFTDEKIKQFCFTGTLRMDDIETILDILTETSPTEYNKNKNTYTFSINTQNMMYYE